MYTCSKTYTDIPFAHRQHKHEGHCSYIHGHNWSIKFTFGCHKLDDNGFVMDFGKMKFIRDWIEINLDHAFVYNKGDTTAEEIISNYPKLLKPYPTAEFAKSQQGIPSSTSSSAQAEDPETVRLTHGAISLERLPVKDKAALLAYTNFLLQPQFRVFIVLNQVSGVRARQNSKKSAGLAPLTRAFFSDFNAAIATEATI